MRVQVIAAARGAAMRIHAPNYRSLRAWWLIRRAGGAYELLADYADQDEAQRVCRALLVDTPLALQHPPVLCPSRLAS